MATKRRPFAARTAAPLFGTSGESAPPPATADGQCPSCHVFMPREFYRGRGPIPRVVHCIGSSTSWQKGQIPNPHHGRVNYGYCWRCQKYLGCDQCCGAPNQVLCKACGAWGTPAAFAENGPVVNTPHMIHKRGGVIAPKFDEYPRHFQWRYTQQNFNEPTAPTLEEWKAAPRPDVREMLEPEPQDYDGDGIFAPPPPK